MSHYFHEFCLNLNDIKCPWPWFWWWYCTKVGWLSLYYVGINSWEGVSSYPTSFWCRTISKITVKGVLAYVPLGKVQVVLLLCLIKRGLVFLLLCHKTGTLQLRVWHIHRGIVCSLFSVFSGSLGGVSVLLKHENCHRVDSMGLNIWWLFASPGIVSNTGVQWSTLYYERIKLAQR